MGQGWRSGLQYLYGEDVEISLETKVKFRNGNDAGDIDAHIYVRETLTVEQVVPSHGRLIYPPDARTMSSRHFLSEIKRSVNNFNVQDKVKQFVHFYSTLLRDKTSSLRLPSDERINFETFSDPLRESINDPDTKLIFLFNGVEFRSIVEMMHGALGISNDDPMRIYGHDIIIVWCSSETLIGWEVGLDRNCKEAQLLEREMELASKDTVIASQSAELASKETVLASQSAELASKDNVIASQSAVLASKDNVIASQSAELASKDSYLSALEAKIERLTENLSRLEGKK